MSVGACPIIGVNTTKSAGKISRTGKLIHGAMKSACFPLELAKFLLQKAYTRDAYAPLLPSRYQWGVRRPHASSADRTSSPRAIPERWQGASIADHPFNQRFFWAAMVNNKASLTLRTEQTEAVRRRRRAMTPQMTRSFDRRAAFYLDS
jgi:hypothetical protein